MAPDLVATDLVATDLLAPDLLAPDLVAPDLVAPDLVATDLLATDLLAIALKSAPAAATGLLLLVGMLAVAPPAMAQPKDGDAISVRVGVSPEAAERLHELRLRRLLRIELSGIAPLEPGAAGPLPEGLIQMWIDVPNPERALIEVRRTGRPLARRAIDIGNFRNDVAARFVAITASEMVWVQATAVVEPEPSKPSGDTGTGAASDGGMAAFALSSAAGLLLLPASSPGAVWGSELSLQHRRGITSQVLYGRWFINDSGHRARWLELGGGIGVHLPIPSEDWRVALAARAGAVALSLPNAAVIEGATTQDTWTARAGAEVSVAYHVAPHAWLTLAVEPGSLLRHVAVSNERGETSDLGGFAMGLSLGVTADPDEL